MSKPSPAAPVESKSIPPEHSAGVVALACAWLVGYFAVFLLTSSSEAQDTPRGGYLLVMLLRPDDLVADWFAGLGWNSVAERLWILLIVLGVLGVAAAAGWLCLRLLRVDRAVTRLEMTLLAVGVGLNLISLATLALGLVGLLRADLFIGLGIATCVASASLRRIGGCASGTCAIQPESVANAAADAWNWSPHWLWLLVPFTLSFVGAAMLPPVDFDVREYHLQAPKEFFLAGQITFLPHNIYANMPLGAEMPALSAMVVSGDWWVGALAGKTLMALFAPLTALLLYAAGCRFASPAAGIVAALTYLSIPWVAIVSTHGLNEGAFAFYLFAALYVVLIWQRGLSHSMRKKGSQDSSRGVLGIAGFLAGGAVSTKYPALVYCAVPLTVYVGYVGWRATGGKQAFTSVAIFCLGVMLGCGLWFAKNAAFTGNPTYPLLYQVFEGATRTPEKEAQWQAAHRPPNFEPGDFFRHAWDFLLAGTWLSPLVVPLALLAWAGRSNKQLSWLLMGAIGFIFVAWWLLTHRIDRFLVPMWPLAALLAGLGATWNASPWWRRTLFGALALGLAYNFVLIAGGPIGDNRYFRSLEELRVESVQLDPWHTYLNEHADEVGRVLLVGDAQPFDLEVPSLYNTVFDDSLFEQFVRDKSPEEVRKALLERGVSHVYVHWPEIERYRSPGNYGITEFLQPRIFADLVTAGVLEPLPQLADHRGQMYRVRGKAH